MTADVWAQVRSALEAALSLTGDERLAFLAGLDADNTALRQEVEDLLAAEPDATQLFSIDLWHKTAAELQCAGEPGMLVGRYRLVRELGRGGMGAVFLAERADGEFTHRVAIKMLQPGVLSAGIAERFRQERQILARLSHPGIARLLDGGVTDAGLLYAVMEYVEGEPIDVYCERNGLDLAARLRLFLRAAEAVQYAHQQLVLHLDIKPANLLVTAQGEPRLLDFGISRMMAQSEEGLAVADVTMRLLTPRYASPEQAAGQPLGVASDVFSLGMLLYRLLAGALPYPLENASPLEAARIIREAPPQPPSRVAPPEMRSQLRGDLDMILLQALRKEPSRRYPTVAALADDLERFLACRPVRAHRDSVGYRAARYLRRHQTAMIMAAAVLVVIAGSVGMVIHSAIVARRQEQIANRRLQDVRELAHSYIFDLDPQLQGIPGTVAVRSFILNTGMKYLDAMAHEAGTDDSLNHEIAQGYLRLSVLENSFLYPSLGEKQQSRDAMDKAVALETAAYQRNPHSLDAIENYLYTSVHAAMNFEGAGDIDRYDDTLRRLWNIGQPLLTARDHPEGLFTMGSIAGEMATNRIGNGALWNFADPLAGLEWNRKSREILERFQAEYPGDRLAKRAMVDTLYTFATEIDGESELANEAGVSKALAGLQREAAMPAFRDDPSLASGQRVAKDYTLAILILEHRLAEAEAFAPRARVNDMPEQGNNSRLRLATASASCVRGALDLELGRAVAGTREMTKGLAVYEDLLREDPSDVNSAVQIVHWGTRLGVEPLAPADVRRKALRRAIELSASYATLHPDVASAQVRMALAWLVLDQIDRETGQFAAAADDSKQAHKALTRLRQLVPHQPQAEMMGSQLDALDSGQLDHQSACRQRIGPMRFLIFLSGPEQIRACSINPARGPSAAVRAPATIGPKPSPDGP